MAMTVPSGALAVAAGDGTGTPMTWPPTISGGDSGVGTLSGLWAGDFDVVGDASAQGTWSDAGTGYAPALQRRLLNWTIGQANGGIAGGGARLTDIMPQQFNPDAAAANHLNDAPCFQGLWVPSVPPPHSVHWVLALGSSGYLSQVIGRDNEYPNGYTLSLALNAQTIFGPGIDIPIPAPAGLALLTFAGSGFLRTRRARRSTLPEVSRPVRPRRQ
jgi:hypothetical protein